MLSPLHSLALPFFRGRFTGVGQRLTMPRPDDAPMAHAPGIDPDRILVFGNGAAVGWGVRSHDLALPGHLARQVSSLTGRGVDVDLVADPTVTIATAERAVPTPRVVSYDAIVVVIGLSDALRMTSVRQYRKFLGALLDRFMDARRDGAEILLVGIHRPSALNVFSLRRDNAIDERAGQFNAVAQEVCAARPRVRYLESPDHDAVMTGKGGRSQLAPDIFRTLAASVATELAPLLDIQAAQGRESCPLRVRQQSDGERLAAIRALGILDSPHEKRFDDIVERARILLGTAGAAFSVVDENRIWNKAVAGAAVVETPLRGAMCAETIKGCGPFIVPDVWSDDRFVTHPSVRFYAGYPVETPDGIRIGALCVTDPNPRAADSVDLVLLRELALAVQRELSLGAVPVSA
ncbi:hypothetical protein GCM10025867_11530 [Frondihabitans sucicola]|uniref:GAF domain-containing protein n=1 Tax=Frondihabitans sucicola TaxID=1268041 RepID=A0ABN6XV56_9MICO|nr:GAF domain-containing protein [Frondihabitans sucicola]BDZ48912.1 hypothetical protein GCM10025867_11530 [Frondihabitans sucicola]